MKKKTFPIAGNTGNEWNVTSQRARSFSKQTNKRGREQRHTLDVTLCTSLVWNCGQIKPPADVADDDVTHFPD